MTHPIQNERWLNCPERRVGSIQLLRARLATLNENDPRYREYRRQLEAGLAGSPNQTEPL